MAESPWLNLYLYPKEADYRRSVSLGSSWHRLETCVRDTDEAYEYVTSRMQETLTALAAGRVLPPFL